MAFLALLLPPIAPLLLLIHTFSSQVPAYAAFTVTHDVVTLSELVRSTVLACERRAHRSITDGVCHV